MTVATEQMVAKRITALVRFVRQLHSAVLAMVAVNVEVFIHGNNTHRLFRALNWFYRFTTSGTSRSVNPVIISDAKDFVFSINREWNAIEADAAGAAPEATGVVRIPHSLQNLFCDKMSTNSTSVGSDLKA